MKRYIGLCMAFVLMLPISASAAETAFFRLTFSATATNGDAYLPIGAVWRGDGALAGYEVLRNGDISTKLGVSTGVILSDASVANGRYVVKDGMTESFTFFGTYRADERIPSATYSLRLNHLPYWKAGADETRYIHQDVLKSFTTKSLSL